MISIAETINNNKAFISYITAGDGGLDYSLEVLLSLADNGVDIIELGIPFSDPVADGPVIQAAMQRSLSVGTTINDVLQLVSDFRKVKDTPIILFGYYNPILQQIENNIYQRIKDAGAQGILLVDLPPEQAKQHCQRCDQVALDPIFLVSPKTPTSRLQKIDKLSRGFVYYVCHLGTTGAREQLPINYQQDIARVQQELQLPIAAGFGISSKAMAAQVLTYADAFIVGSYLVAAMANKTPAKQIGELARGLDPR